MCQVELKMAAETVGVISTHFLRGLVHTLHAGCSAVVQKQWLLPVVVVCLQNIPSAQLHVNPVIKFKSQHAVMLNSWLIR